jgi:hypothetical protein
MACTFVCTGVTPGTKNNKKKEGWQDRLPPVLGVMCNALLLEKHGRDLSHLALFNKRSRVDRDGAYFGSVIKDQREHRELYSWSPK